MDNRLTLFMMLHAIDAIGHNASYHTAYMDVCIKFLAASFRSESADV